MSTVRAEALRCAEHPEAFQDGSRAVTVHSALRVLQLPAQPSSSPRGGVQLALPPSRAKLGPSATSLRCVLTAPLLSRYRRGEPVHIDYGAVEAKMAHDRHVALLPLADDTGLQRSPNILLKLHGINSPPTAGGRVSGEIEPSVD